MKPRARRITIGAAALVGVLVAILVVACWSIVRDHIEAWHFQLTRETKTIEPIADAHGIRTYEYPTHQNEIVQRLFGLLDMSGRAVIFDFDESHDAAFGDPPPSPYANLGLRSATDVMRVLEGEGWRVLEQRFPRRAYVVIRDARPMWIEYPGGSPHNGTERP